MRRRSSIRYRHSKLPFLILAFLVVHPLNHHVLPNTHNFVAADGLLTNLAYKLNDRLFPPEDYINYDDLETKSLDIIQISNMRVRDIKRRLARHHGYGADELSRMLDKKDLINTLSFEEHKVYQQELDRRKSRRIKSTIIYTFAAVLIVIFWPLLKHAFEVVHVNFIVYTDKRRHELSRCREYKSFKGYFGVFLLLIIDFLSTWLSASVLLSWVMKSKYFFPVPNLPIRPAQLLSGGGDSGALGLYGINVGPMVISGLFRILNNRVEVMIGNAVSKAFQNQRRREKEEMKRARKEERAKEKEERRKMVKESKLRMEEEKRAREEEVEELNRARGADEKNTTSTSNGISHGGVYLGSEEYNSSPFEDLD